MKLIADSGATKTTWCLVGKRKNKLFQTQGLSPYYFNSDQISEAINIELLPLLKHKEITEVYFYGTGCATANLQKVVKKALISRFPAASMIEVHSDLTGAARATCGFENGVVGILGTGSNSCVFNGRKIIKNNPAPGFILGDEGSGAYLGKKVLQHFIYQTFDEDLLHKFKSSYSSDYREILDRLYKQPMPNRYLASFAPFLSENRDHYMVENILEDGLNDFIMTHLFKYSESWVFPIHFCGSIAWHFRDKLEDICSSLELQTGKILKSPIEGLVKYHDT